MPTDPPDPGPYPPDFYRRQRGGSLRSARAVVAVVLPLVRPASVVDFGCGVGTWLRAFREAGVADVLGLDGDHVDRGMLEIPAERFRAADLTAPPPLGRRFDLALCLEVGEHLPAAAAAPLVAELVAAAPCVLFSAAVPGQGGVHHVNEAWPSFWAERFAAHGYERLDPVRPRVWRDPAVRWWYKQNTYLFCGREAIGSSPALARELEMARAFPFELVHDKVFRRLTSRRRRGGDQPAGES
jgi:SAM-dependent methyltransferase